MTGGRPLGPSTFRPSLTEPRVVLPIYTYGQPVLRERAEPVEGDSPELQQLVDDMIETMHVATGIGLAAPQVGVLERLIVVDCVKDEGAAPRPIVMFNPRVVSASDATSTYEEGCLSIPDQYADVERPKMVEVEWLDRDGKLQKEEFDGLWATCVQHEIDHLDGKLFIDYLKPLKRQMITRKMVKLKRERARG